MADEVVITVNFRKKVYKTPRYKRSKRTINLLRQFLKKISKGKEVKIDRKISEAIFKHSKKPITKIKIKVIKESEEKYRAELVE
ncbi:MAG: hypothetical protein B6U78_02070 [Candidatus Aenigmarchaeota archaeon ex4484_224]|nr:MAG: hypothetical protein B6U78_02070 [Candidatus Aenigmarchaeota archaeon ex4484_224]